MTGLDPHYLHEHSGLEAVVSPPVDGVLAAAWHPRREELVVADRDGQLSLVDPVMGTRVIADDLPEAGAIAISRDGERVAVLGRGAPLVVRPLGAGDAHFSVPLALLSDLWVGFFNGGVAVVGQGLEGRELRVFDMAGRPRANAQVPPGVVVGLDADGRLLMGRVTSTGPEVLHIGRGRLSRRKPTSHRLRFGQAGLLFGVAEGGVTVWPRGAPPLTVRMFGVSAAAVSRDGQLLALGTRDGEVALAGLDSGALDRGRPGRTGGHDQPVRSLSFSCRGRWLASVGDRTWLWSY